MLLSLFCCITDSLGPLKSKKKEKKNLETEIKKVGYEMGNGRKKKGTAHSIYSLPSITPLMFPDME